MSSDFVIAGEMRLQNLRTVYDAEAVSFEETNRRARDEFRMRVRIIEQTLSAMARYSELLSIRKHGMFAFQMLSHKVMRYAVPLFLIVAFVSSVALADESLFFRVLFFGQAAFYAIAAGGVFLERSGRGSGVLSLPYYFVLANAASVVGFLKFLNGQAHLVWQPVRDPQPEGEA